jgi:DNA polymerase I-like protein with 3'-5' exonuclease and polymerase domains
MLRLIRLRLYGATGYGRTPPQARYYEQFIEKYAGIAAYHKQLTRDVLTTGYITLPSKRQYDFSHSVRRKDGTPTHFTQIKNYPVQGFATGDIVPLILTVFDNMLEGMLSCIVNSVHDSIVIDIHPDEKEAVLDIVQYINTNLKKIIDTEWGIDINVPLLLEAKTGPNWLDMKEVA